MGVMGLTSLMERLTKDANRPPTDLGKIASDYVQSGSRLTLLVDQSVVMQITCPESLTDQLLPSYSYIDSVVSKFVFDFARHNINLIFYFDGTSGTSYELQKQLESIKRREDDIDNIIDLEDYVNSNASGAKPKGSFRAFLFRWQCLRTLARVGAKTAMCVGEADFALSVDGCADGTYVLASDSDFFICKGIKFIPFNTIRHVDNTILCQTYTVEDTSLLLGVPVDSFVDVAVLSGNDYTRNLACWREMKTKHASPENTITSALNAIKTSNALYTTYKQLLASNTDMQNVYALSSNLYGFTFTTPPAETDNPDDYLEMLRMGVQLGRFPYSTLSIAKNGILGTAVLPETLSGPTTTEIVRPLIGAIFVLLGRTDGTLLTRKGAHFIKQEFDPVEAVSGPFSSIPADSTSVWQRFTIFHQGIFSSFGCIKNLLEEPPFSGGGKSTDFCVLPPEKLNVYTVHPYHFAELTCIYTTAASFERGDPLTRGEVAAFLACRVILHAASKLNAKVTAVSHYHDKALPPMRLITVISRFHVVLHNLKDITQLLGLFGEWVDTPAHIFDGHLFALMCVPALEEEELEEVMMERLESALSQNLIRFSANADRAIAEIRTSMETEFVDSYYEVLHAFGDELPCANATPKEKAVEFEYAAPTPLRDTTLHMESPIQLSSLLTPQHASQISQTNYNANNNNYSVNNNNNLNTNNNSNTTPTKTLRFDDPTTPTQQQLYEQQRNNAGKEDLLRARALDALENKLTENGEDEPLPTYNHKVLPIVKYIDTIAETVRDNPVTIIQGETGCGKSSGVPQILLDKVTLTGNKKRFIVVTQPRRIAAMSLATYVTKLRGAKAEHEIGYAVGNDRQYTEDCTLLFVTTGWLLQKLVFNSWFFEKCTHIVLDEVHERSVDADLLFLVVKQLFQQSFNENWKANGTRLILMSATFNSETFGSYFSMPGYPIPDPIFVGVQRYPTEIFYLDDLLENKAIDLKGIPYGETSLIQLGRKIEGPLHNTSSAPLDKMIELCVYICGRIALHHKRDERGNCIIVFLPGIMEIEQMVDSLKEILGGREEEEYMSLIILHSMIEKEDQMRAFEPLEPCVTRLVLSTNIAESSITLPMVRYVLDLGMHKQMFHSVKYNSPCLMGMWVSQASSMQRSGRAGRLFPGTIFRIYSRNFYSMLPAYDPPEILRISLDTTLLRLLVLGEQSGGGPFESPSSALARALDPPTEEAVTSAYTSLLQVGAIIRPGEEDPLAERANKDGVALTSLGQFLTHIPFDLRVGRMVAFGAIVGKYLPHTLIMAAALSLQEVFMMPNFMKGDSSLLSLVSSTQKARIWFDRGCFSDCVASVRIYLEYSKAKRRAKMSQQKAQHGKMMFWCRDNGIHFKRMKLLVNTISEVAKRIIQSEAQYTRYLHQLCKSNDFQHSEELTCLPLEAEDVAILKLILANTFASNVVVATIKRSGKDLMHDTVEIGKVPGRVMSDTFKTRVESLTAPFQNFSYENTHAPKKKKSAINQKGNKGIAEVPEDVPEGPPEAYFKVGIRFYGSSEIDPLSPLVYPPIGKHVLSKFFYRGELSVLPGVFTDHAHAIPSTAPTSFTSFAAREPSHVLTEINTGWSVGWKKAGGGPSLMLDKACPLSTLQLAPHACAGGKKALHVYAVAPFLTALGSNQRVMLAERLTLLPCDDTQPTSALFLALSVKNMETDLIMDSNGEIDAVRLGDFHLPLTPKLPAAVKPLLQSVHNYVTLGLFDIMSWTVENRRQLLASLRRVVGLTLADCGTIGDVPYSPLSIYNNPAYNSARFTFSNGARVGEGKGKKPAELAKKEKFDREKREKKERKDRPPKTPEQIQQKAQRKAQKKAKEEKKAAKLALKQGRKAARNAEQQLLQEQIQRTLVQQKAEAMHDMMGNLSLDPSSSSSSSTFHPSNGTPGTSFAPPYPPSYPPSHPPSSSSSMPFSPSPAGPPSAPSSAGKKPKLPRSTCLVCQNPYIGYYEGHVTSKEHLAVVAKGVDKSKRHEVKLSHITAVLQQSPNKQYNKQAVCPLCLQGVTRKKLDGHMTKCKTNVNN